MIKRTIMNHKLDIIIYHTITRLYTISNIAQRSDLKCTFNNELQNAQIFNECKIDKMRNNNYYHKCKLYHNSLYLKSCQQHNVEKLK